MRRPIASALLAAPALAAIASYPCAAQATSVDLLWTGTTGTGTPGSNAIAVSGTSAETLTLEIVIDADSAGVSTAWISLEFDRDLGNELDLLSFQELAFEGLTRSLYPQYEGLQSSWESSESEEGRLYSFEGFNLCCDDGGPADVSFAFARVVFETNPGNVSLDGDDVVSGSFGPDGSGSDDGLFDNSDPGNEITGSVPFGAAHVGPAGDGDGDGVADFLDNCRDWVNTAQIDSDGDGCGNACDGDYDQNGLVGSGDFNRFRGAFGTSVGMPGYDPSIDADADNVVGSTDYNFFRLVFGQAPGPSHNPERDPQLCSDQ